MKPYFVTEPADVSVREGEDVTLQCQVYICVAWVPTNLAFLQTFTKFYIESLHCILYYLLYFLDNILWLLKIYFSIKADWLKMIHEEYDWLTQSELRILLAEANWTKSPIGWMQTERGILLAEANWTKNPIGWSKLNQ